jgi:prolyl 4-hydroxylase
MFPTACSKLCLRQASGRLLAMRCANIAPGIFKIESFLNSLECTALVKRAEDLGFEPAPIVTAGGVKVQMDTRNNDRCVFDDPPLAEQLWSRARAGIPAVFDGRQALSLNERFRLYYPGQRFAWHADVPYRRANGEISLLTFMVYLNSGYEGGATRFESTKVSGEEGMALIFQHGLVHEGTEVVRGVKYALRSDVMYGPLEEG